MNLGNLIWPDGAVNPSGIKSKLFALMGRDITKWPTLDLAAATAEARVTYDGDFELKEGATAIELYSTQGKGQLEFEATGEKDCKGFLNKGTFKYPDMSAQAKAFASQRLNSNSIFIAAHFVAGGGIDWIVLGSENFDSDVNITGTSGAAFGDEKGLTIEVSAPDFAALPRYKGIIPLSDGTFDCSTNTFTPKP